MGYIPQSKTSHEKTWVSQSLWKWRAMKLAKLPFAVVLILLFVNALSIQLHVNVKKNSKPWNSTTASILLQFSFEKQLVSRNLKVYTWTWLSGQPRSYDGSNKILYNTYPKISQDQRIILPSYHFSNLCIKISSFKWHKWRGKYRRLVVVASSNKLE